MLSCLENAVQLKKQYNFLPHIIVQNKANHLKSLIFLWDQQDDTFSYLSECKKLLTVSPRFQAYNPFTSTVIASTHQAPVPLMLPFLPHIVHTCSLCPYLHLSVRNLSISSAWLITVPHFHGTPLQPEISFTLSVRHSKHLFLETISHG